MDITKNYNWVEKYRPESVKDYVFSSEELKQKVTNWIATKEIPNLLLYGVAGTGKSSLVNVLLKELNITDYKIINGSNQTSVDYTRQMIEYASIPALDNNYKVIVFEECDRLSKAAQDSLKESIEMVSKWCRFIFTTNHIEDISPRLKSRCEEIQFADMNKTDFTNRCIQILKSENINITETDLPIIAKYITKHYPDLRKTINTIQYNIVDGKLVDCDNSSSNGDIFDSVISDIYSGNIIEARKKLCEMEVSRYIDFYNYLYTKDLKFTCKPADAYIIIAKYLYQHSQVALPEINLTACLIELFRTDTVL